MKKEVGRYTISRKQVISVNFTSLELKTQLLRLQLVSFMTSSDHGWFLSVTMVVSSSFKNYDI